MPDDVPGAVMVHELLVDEDAQELDDGESWVGVVELDRGLFWEV